MGKGTNPACCGDWASTVKPNKGYKPYAASSDAWAEAMKATGTETPVLALRALQALGWSEREVSNGYGLSRWAVRYVCNTHGIVLADGRSTGRRNTTKEKTR